MEARHEVQCLFLAVWICCKSHHVCTFTINLVTCGAVQSPSKLTSEQKSDMRHVTKHLLLLSSLQASCTKPYCGKQKLNTVTYTYYIN